MKNKFYPIVLVFLLFGLSRAEAGRRERLAARVNAGARWRDTVSCNPRFEAEISGLQVYFRTVDSLARSNRDNAIVSNMSVQGQQGVNHLQVPLGRLESGIYNNQVKYGNEGRMSKIQKLSAGMAEAGEREIPPRGACRHRAGFDKYLRP